MQVTTEEAEQEARMVPVRTLAFILFTILTSTLIVSASAQPPTPPTPPVLTDLNITPAEIEPGNEVNITFTITNSDDQTFTYTATMEIGILTLLIDVELEAYESKTVSRTITQYIPGDYNVTVDGLEGTFTVKYPEIIVPPLPPFLSDLTITPEEIERGDNVTISFDIMNTDSQSITYGVTMWIENAAFPPPFWPPYDVTLRIWVDLEAYKSKTVSQNITLYDIGEYHVWVEGLTGIFTVGTWPPLKPAEFVVSELGVSPAEVEVGEDVIFCVLVTNIGETEGSYTVEFKVDGETVATKKVTLAAARGLPVLVPFKTLSVGIYQVSVGDLTEIFDVRAPLEPAEFEFSDLRIFYPGVIPPEVERGQTVTVTVSIEAENVGELEGGRTVELKVDGEVVDSKGVTLEGGASATVLFELTRGEGTHEVEVEGFTDSFTVNPQPSFWDKIPGFPYESIILGLATGAFVFWSLSRRKMTLT